MNAPTVIMTQQVQLRAPTDFLLTNEFTDARSFLTTKNLLLFSSTPSTVFLLFPERILLAKLRCVHFTDETECHLAGGSVAALCYSTLCAPTARSRSNTPSAFTKRSKLPEIVIKPTEPIIVANNVQHNILQFLRQTWQARDCLIGQKGKF